MKLPNVIGTADSFPFLSYQHVILLYKLILVLKYQLKADTKLISIKEV